MSALTPTKIKRAIARTEAKVRFISFLPPTSITDAQLRKRVEHVIHYETIISIHQQHMLAHVTIFHLFWQLRQLQEESWRNLCQLFGLRIRIIYFQRNTLRVGLENCLSHLGPVGALEFALDGRAYVVGKVRLK